MTSISERDEPEFRGKTLSPVSPRPVHIPDPANIPVLENQMDQAFNETSTHIPPAPSSLPPNNMSPTTYNDNPAVLSPEQSSSLSSCSYRDEDDPEHQGETTLANNGDGQDDNDEYAMDVEGDERGFAPSMMDREGTDVTSSKGLTLAQAAVTADTSGENDESLPTLPPSSTHPTADPGVSHAVLVETTANPTNPLLSSLILPKDTVSILNSVEDPPTSAHDQAEDANVLHRAAGTEKTSEVTDGGVNIQALLDNLSAPAATAATAPLAAGVTTGATSGNPPSTTTLPAHVTLPPRPPPQAKPASHPGYSPQDDIRSYHPHTPHAPTQSQTHPPNPSQAPISAKSVPTKSGYPSQHNPSYRPPGPPGLGVSPLAAAGAPGTASQPLPGLPPPPVATFQQSQAVATTPNNPAPQTPVVHSQSERRVSHSVASADDEDERPWGAEVQKLYDAFLQEERAYVTEGQWDRFPLNSRLFIGNLPTEKVTKRDIFHIFHKHGKLAQVSIKQAYGFVQFLDAGACYRALQMEQGAAVRGRKMHLEISKPQKNTRNATTDVGLSGRLNRRSRSPDYDRGVPLSPRARNGHTMGGGGGGGRYGPDRVDRGVPSHQRSGRGDRGSFDDSRARGRDDYRPVRSPSPRSPRGGNSYRPHDDYRGGRDTRRDSGRERYDRRSRSRSPYGRGGGRYRSRTPPLREADDDAELPLPRRAARDIPEAQVIVMDDLDRNFVNYILTTFRDRSIQTDVLFLNPRLPLDAVIKRQILEGVQAVVRLSRQSQATVKIPLQVFDRRAGVDNVRFEEYVDLEPHIAAELVLRAKGTHGAPAPNPYSPARAYGGYNPPAAPSQQPAPPSGANEPDLSSLITSLDGPTLQKLIGALQSQPQSSPSHAASVSQSHQSRPHPQQPQGLSSDLAALLATATRPQPSSHSPSASYPPHQQGTHPYAASAPHSSLQGTEGLAGLLAAAAASTSTAKVPATQQNGPSRGQAGDGLGSASRGGGGPQGSAPQEGGGSQQQVRDIMAQLARWKQ